MAPDWDEKQMTANWQLLRCVLSMKFLKEYVFGVADGARGRRPVGCAADTS